MTEAQTVVMGQKCFSPTRRHGEARSIRRACVCVCSMSVWLCVCVFVYACMLFGIATWCVHSGVSQWCSCIVFVLY